MSRTRTLRAAGTAAAAAVALVAVPAADAGHVKAGPNLVLNPGFEDSAFEGPAAPPGSLAQPLLPTEWTFEGLTLLFDHSPNTYHGGKRSAAVSGSLSGPDKICPAPPTCVDNPTTGIKDQLAPTYTLAPHWRTADPIPVTAGTEYAFNFWVSWVQVTVGQGVSVKVRWTKADGTALIETITEKRSTADNNLDLPWAEQKLKVKAPDGAAGAILMLGQTDDAWTGQVVFDDVHFGTAAH